MKKCLGVITALLLLVVLTVGCASLPLTPTSLVSGDSGNFRLLLSDEVNAIADFDSVNVTISKIGLKMGGEAGKWTEISLDAPWRGDIKALIGVNAVEVWEGNIDHGEYSEAFIYVDTVEANLAGGADVPAIKLPSGKLHIAKPFTVATEGEDLTVDFVFDITVVKAGESGKYILKPQIIESGADQDYREITDAGKGSKASEEVKLKGTIKAVDGNTWTVKIGSDERVVNVETAEIEGKAAAGLKVKIEGTLGENDIILAGAVEVKESGK